MEKSATDEARADHADEVPDWEVNPHAADYRSVRVGFQRERELMACAARLRIPGLDRRLVSKVRRVLNDNSCAVRIAWTEDPPGMWVQANAVALTPQLVGRAVDWLIAELEEQHAQPPTDEQRAKVDELRRRLAEVERERDAMLRTPEDGAPAGWDRIEGGTEASGWEELDRAEAEDRDLERAELDNARRALDLQERELALDERRESRLLLAGGEALRVAALTTAREVAAGYQYMSPTEQGRAVEARYRQFLGLLEETSTQPE